MPSHTTIHSHLGYNPLDSIIIIARYILVHLGYIANYFCLGISRFSQPIKTYQTLLKSSDPSLAKAINLLLSFTALVILQMEYQNFSKQVTASIVLSTIHFS